MSRPEFTEEELRALEAELDRVTVDDVLLQTVVSLLNLGARKAGLGQPGAQGDFEQLRQAIEAARALMPLLEARHGDKLGPVRDTLSQLQMVYAQNAQGGGGGEPGGPGQPGGSGEPGGGAGSGGSGPGGPGPAQQSGRLWVPGQ
jgi:hypothetical protein